MDDLSRGIALEFLSAWLDDRERGVERPLAEYLARFPGHEQVVAEAFAQAHRAPGDAQSRPSAALDAERVGPFRLLRELGRGAQGSVWLARDERLGRDVALKLVPRSPLWGELGPRFEREARAASRLDHPSLCAVYEVGSDARHAWIAMRYVEGETLAVRIARGGLGDTAQRLALLEALARALHVAHESGVVHRDIKPGNVIVTPAGEPVVLDFGIARDDDAGAPLTLTGDALGTPAYMSPEQLRGERGRVDRRADVWALGVTAFETLTGRRPFDAPTREALVRSILDDEPPMPRELSRDLAVVLCTALEKDLERRYRSALDLAEDLRRVREHEPILARTAGAALRLRRWTQRNPRLAASLATLFLVLAAALAVTWSLLTRTRAALDDKRALLGDLAQLSDQSLARDLLAEEHTLWPAKAELLPRFDDWLARAGEIVARRERHAATRTGLAARTDLDPDPVRNAAARAWLGEQLTKLLAALDELDGRSATVRARRELGAQLEPRSISGQRAEWERASAEIAADPRYHGLLLRPQLGLVPLGRDPRSGLQEFAHLASGEPPARGADGVLCLTQASGIVLVLLPAGEVLVGSDKSHDPWTARWDYPETEVALDAFFLGKYELTQGQWLRHDGANPSIYKAPSKLISPSVPLLHPVENVGWEEAAGVLREMDLTLPTEARWEYGARGGTRSVWYTGDQPETLQGYENLSDRYAREHEGGANWKYELELDDGSLSHAPVGSYEPNAFGLHDTLGNVVEWCLDTWEDLATVTPRAGDGLFIGSETVHVLRGGSFSSSAPDSRCGFRNGFPSPSAAPNWGLRAARGIDP